MNRRAFLSTGAAVGAFTIIPNHVFAAAKKGMVAPSDKIRMVHIGCGTQGLSELEALLKAPTAAPVDKNARRFIFNGCFLFSIFGINIS